MRFENCELPMIATTTQPSFYQKIKANNQTVETLFSSKNFCCFVKSRYFSH